MLVVAGTADLRVPAVEEAERFAAEAGAAMELAAASVHRGGGAPESARLAAAVRALAQAPSVALGWPPYELFVRPLSPSPP